MPAQPFSGILAEVLAAVVQLESVPDLDLRSVAAWARYDQTCHIWDPSSQSAQGLEAQLQGQREKIALLHVLRALEAHAQAEQY